MTRNDYFEEKWDALFEDLNEYSNGGCGRDKKHQDEKHCCPPPCPKPCPRPCPKPCPKPCPEPCPKPCPRPALVNGIQALLTGSTLTVANNSPVVFNQVINTVGPHITYTNAGTFIITKPGTYSITWWVAGSVPAGTDSIDFAIQTTNAIPVSVPGSFPIPTNIGPVPPVQVDGNALITVLNTPATLSLVNISGAPVTYATTVAAQASIVITEITV